MAFKPSGPFNVAMRLLIPQESQTLGVTKKTFPAPADSPQIFASIRQFSGMERLTDGVVQPVNQITACTWYRPDIKADCKLYLEFTGETYDIQGEPEDIEMRHKWLLVKIKKAGGRA